MEENWVNNEVKIDFELPKRIQNILNEMEEANRKDEFGTYFELVEVLDVVCKNYCGEEGGITKKQWEIIDERYLSLWN